MSEKYDKLYKELSPCVGLSDFIDSFWMHKNPFEYQQKVTLSASSFIKIVFFVNDGKIIYYILTGIWTEPKETFIPPKTTIYGCRLKFLAAEFLLQRETATLKNIMLRLDTSFMNASNFKLEGFESIKEQWEKEFIKNLSPKAIVDQKLRLSSLLYSNQFEYTAKDVSNKIFWTNRQINRYLNKYIGISLKKYLNLLKCRESINQIIDGKLTPSENYYDRPHFIREVKKHTGTTPKNIFAQKNDRFIQLYNISKK